MADGVAEVYPVTMNPSNRGTKAATGQPFRIPQPPPQSLGRPQHLILLGESEPVAATSGGGDPQRPAAVTGTAASATSPEPPLASATRRLERELADLEEEVAALQGMLQELPTIFERKFQGRLQQLLDQQHSLEGENQALRKRLLAIAPGAENDPLPLRPRGLLPPAIRAALKQRAEAGDRNGSLSDAELTRAGSANPTHR
jgi:TolA-binding protein